METVTSKIRLNIRVEPRWWVKPAIVVWAACCCLANREPDGRVLGWIARYGFRYRIGR